MDTDAIETIEDPIDDLETVEESPVVADESGKVPFFRNWIWWCSLVTVPPAAFLLYEILQGAVGLGEQSNFVWFATMFITGICACAAMSIPLLLGLGKFQGGELVELPAGLVPAMAGSDGSSVVASANISDIDYGPDDSDEMDELFDSTDAAVAFDQESDDDLDDFDDF